MMEILKQPKCNCLSYIDMEIQKQLKFNCLFYIDRDILEIQKQPKFNFLSNIDTTEIQKQNLNFLVSSILIWRYKNI